MTIVRTHYRYERPPGRKKPVALEMPAVVRAGAPGKVSSRLTHPRGGSNRPSIRHAPAKILPPGLLPDTPEEHQRRGDAADALWRELMRRVAEKT